MVLNKSFFLKKNLMELETPPPIMEKAMKNFHTFLSLPWCYVCKAHNVISCKKTKHSKNQNRWIYNIIRAVQLRITQNNLKGRVADSRFTNFFPNKYVIYESLCLEDSEYLWKSWVESLCGQVTAEWSWPLFQGKKIYLPQFNRKLCCYNFRDKSFTLNQWPPPLQNSGKDLSLWTEKTDKWCWGVI